MSTMYDYRCALLDGVDVHIHITRRHPDANWIWPSKNMALGMIYSAIDHWSHQREEKRGIGSPLDQMFSSRDFYNAEYLRLVAQEFIDSVEVKTLESNDDGDPTALYKIKLTDAKWGEHLKTGLEWDGSEYDRGNDIQLHEPPDFTGIETWGELDLSNCRLTQFPEEVLLRGQKLERIDASGNFFKILPEHFGNLKALKELNLENNMLRRLPESFCELEQLEKLNLVENQLDSLPEAFGKLQRLRELELSETNDSMPDEFPASFTQLSSLEVLRAKGKGLTVWPADFSRLSSLRELRVCNNTGPGLLPGFFEVCFLENLELLEINAPYECLREIKYLRKLKHLELDGANFRRLPDEFAQLASLEYLNLRHNEFSSFPEPLRGLAPHLKELHLEYTPFGVLPEWIGEFQSLEVLDVGSCGLTSLPASLGHCSRLRKLRLNSNKLTRLPESLQRCRELEVLELEYNDMDDIPSWLGDFPKLKELRISSGNCLDDIDAWKDRLPDVWVS